MQAEHISVLSPTHPHRSTHSFSPDSKLNRFLILRAGQEIATSPLQRPGQYVLYETLLLALKKCTSSTSLCVSQPSHHYKPQASCLHSAWTPQQPYAIREEPTAAILINIDLVSTYPSGSVWNSRYCISTPTANNPQSILGSCLG